MNQYLPSNEAEINFTDTLNSIASGGEPIAIERLGKEPVYLISSQDYQLFLKLLEEAEDKADLQEAEKRMNDPQQEKLSFDEFFTELEVGCESLSYSI